jgi:hypothetical protein
MAIQDRVFFVIEPGGEAEAIWKEYLKNKRKRDRESKKLREETPSADGFWGSSSRPLLALISKDREAVKGWKKKKERDGTITMWPDKRTKLGKEIDKRIQSINDICDREQVASSFFEGNATHWGDRNPHGTGFLVTYPSFGTTKSGKVVVSVHKRAKAKPIGGLKKIKLSEYFKLEGD